MPTELAIAFGLFAALVIGALIYAVVRLLRDEPPTNLSARSLRLSSRTGFPRLFDSLLARPLNQREKLGWLLFAFVVVLAVTFTGGR